MKIPPLHLNLRVIVSLILYIGWNLLIMSFLVNLILLSHRFMSLLDMGIDHVQPFRSHIYIMHHLLMWLLLIIGNTIPITFLILLHYIACLHPPYHDIKQDMMTFRIKPKPLCLDTLIFLMVMSYSIVGLEGLGKFMPCIVVLEWSSIHGHMFNLQDR